MNGNGFIQGIRPFAPEPPKPELFENAGHHSVDPLAGSHQQGNRPDCGKRRQEGRESSDMPEASPLRPARLVALIAASLYSPFKSLMALMNAGTGASGPAQRHQDDNLCVKRRLEEIVNPSFQFGKAVFETHFRQRTAGIYFNTCHLINANLCLFVIPANGGIRYSNANTRAVTGFRVYDDFFAGSSVMK